MNWLGVTYLPFTISLSSDAGYAADLPLALCLCLCFIGSPQSTSGLGVCVSYCRTYDKAVCGGGGG
jgi:hypothetical protein